MNRPPRPLLRLLLPLLIASWAGSSHALDCKNAMSTPDINECAAIGQKKVEDKLNLAYQDKLKYFNDPEDAGTKKSLIAAQRAWVKFREADCNAVYEQWKTGTIRTVMFIECMQKRAETRIKELEDYQPR
jgi:uncharacterized protein YecT (DUF1311 family)